MTELKTELRRALEDWNIVTTKALLNDDQYQTQVEEQSMELVGMVCEYLTPQVEEAGPHFARCCQDILLILAKRGIAKENLIALLEHLEAFRSLRLVRRLLPALSVTLFNIKAKSKSHAWSWALDTLACHMKTIQEPENKGLEGVERLTLDLDSNNSEIIDFVDDLPPLLEPLVDHCLTCEEQTSAENKLRKSYLIKFILQSLGHPVAYLHQHPEQGQGGDQLFPRSFQSSSRLVLFLSTLTADMFGDIISLPGVISEKEKNDFGNLDLSIGVYLYLVFGEGVCVEDVANVYSHTHVLRSSCRFIVRMLRSTLDTVNLKGLVLLNSLVNRIPVNWLTGDSSCDPEVVSLIEPLTRVIVHHNIAEHRTAAFQCFQKFVGLFDVESRFDLYRYLFNNLNHSGLLGWCVTHLKNTLQAVYSQLGGTAGVQSLEQLNSLCQLYTGGKMVTLFRQLFCLKHGAQTDLLEISDELIAEINLAYFVAVRNPAGLQGIDLKVWVQQIREGLNMSRAHWELELKNLDQPMTGQQQQQEAPQLSVTVGSMSLPEMEPKQKKEVIKSALTTLDVIQFNLVPLSSKFE